MNPNMTYKENKDIETRLRNENAYPVYNMEKKMNNDKKILCKNCAFGEFLPQVLGMQQLGLGCCRKNPPVPLIVVQRGALGQQSTGIQPVFPPVFETDWCGSAAPDRELKIVN